MYLHEASRRHETFSGRNDTGCLPHIGAFGQPPRPEIRPVAAMSAENAAELVSAAWSAIEAVHEEYAHRVDRLSHEPSSAELAYVRCKRVGGARSDLDFWGDCLSLSGDRVYAEVFVRKDLIPVMELVVALVTTSQASEPRQPSLNSMLAVRDEIIATARAILLTSCDGMSDLRQQRQTH